MTCTETRDHLLQADPEALAGHGDTEVAAHLRTCARCRSVAGLLLAEQAALGAALAAFRPARTADEAVDLVRAGAAAAPPARADRPARRLARTLRLALPLALVAALGAVLVLNQPGVPPLVVRPAPPSAPPPACTVGPRQGAIVFATSRPDVTIIWLYDKEATP